MFFDADADPGPDPEEHPGPDADHYILCQPREIRESQSYSLSDLEVLSREGNRKFSNL